MGTQVTVSKIPNCDICANAIVPQQVPAYADAKLSIGPWANVCRKHFETYGCSLGTGRGQELILRETDSGTNPFGKCKAGHSKFRGGCPDCAADMVRQF